jgi:hypothetical protein
MAIHLSQSRCPRLAPRAWFVAALTAAFGSACGTETPVNPAGTGGSGNASGNGSGGIVTSSGGTPSGGSPGTGGTSAGGTTTGGTASGGKATGGATTGGTPSGGNTTGGTSAGGSASGGKATGGATGTGGSGGQPACTRSVLQTAIDSYLSALAAGNYTTMSLASGAKYSENSASVSFGQGLWATPLTPDFHRNLLDVDKCSTFSEVIIASGSHPYVLGVRLTVQGTQISAISVIATDCDDWGFNAQGYLTNSRNEESGWGSVATSDQLSRQELQAAGDAYFAYWADKTVQVPWGYPCSRLEGGMETNPTGNASVTCDVGVPSQSFAPKANDYLMDVDYGMIVLFLNMPGPDSHWFRVTKSTKIRYIHTLTVCYVNGTWQCPGSAPTCS